MALKASDVAVAPSTAGLFGKCVYPRARYLEDPCGSG